MLFPLHKLRSSWKGSKYLFVCIVLVFWNNTYLSRIYSAIRTTKGKKFLLFYGFRYLCDHICNENSYWYCELRSTYPARTSQKGDEEATATPPYNQESNKQRNEVKQFKTTLKHRILEGPASIRKIFCTKLINEYTTNSENACVLSPFFEIKSSLYRTKNQNYPPLPKSINDASIEGKRYSMKCAFIPYHPSILY